MIVESLHSAFDIQCKSILMDFKTNLHFFKYTYTKHKCMHARVVVILMDDTGLMIQISGNI